MKAVADGPLGVSRPTSQPPLERALLEQAAQWMVRIKAAPFSARDEQELARWLARSEQHRQAWALAQAMLKQLDGLPAELAKPVLTRAGAQRRRVVHGLAGLFVTGVGLGAIGLQQSTPWQSWFADLSTATGERRQMQLADGSLLELNTDTAVDVRFDAATRVLRLLHGEILVTTGKDRDHLGAQRPLAVETAQGRIRALGTRFSVRSDRAGETEVVVYEDAVDVTPVQGSTAPIRLTSAQQLRFSAAKVLDERPAPPQADAWTRGVYLAVDVRLDDFLAELGRYHRGAIWCDASVKHLRVTGTYGLNDVPAAVASLQASHPVRVSRLTRHLIRVSAS